MHGSHTIDIERKSLVGQTLLTSINVYPIKSVAGISVSSWDVVASGLRFDRHWMVVDAAGGCLTQREEPRLALVSVILDSSALTVEAPGMCSLTISTRNTSRSRVRARIWNDEVDTVPTGLLADEWFSTFLDNHCRLVQMPVGRGRSISRKGFDARVDFADRYPFLLVSQQSLDDLNARLEGPLPANRFRANFIVSTDSPYAEDTWQIMQIASIRFLLAKACPRCAITTIDQATTERGVEPLKTLATYRRRDIGLVFGQNLIHQGSGQVRVGDEVRIERRCPG